MPRKLLAFVNTPQAMPDKREAELRREDFQEIYDRYSLENAEEQASRCSQCGVPFCQIHCPLHNNIPDWLKLAAEDRLEEAYGLSSETNNFPEICGRICPQDKLCEGNCVIEQSTHGAVTIGAIEKFITDTAFDNGWIKPIQPMRERPETVGIIGAGPAGLAAADMLRRDGFQVDVYDRHDRPGGLLVYGIPNFKLDKELVARRVRLLAEGRVRFHCGVEVGRTISFGALRERHDAILIATGVYRARDLNIPGRTLPGTVAALDYLIASNRAGLGAAAAPSPDDEGLSARGRHVVVIGGGDTAMDCVRTAIRQDAASVQCLYRRNRANMPGSQREVQHAEEEGVKFVWQTMPEAFLAGSHGSLATVQASRIHLGVADQTGRQAPQLLAGSGFSLTADLAILALGFDPEDLPTIFDAPTLTVNHWGTLQTNPHGYMTSIPGVFAAGDIVRGASLVVWAIREGREAAAGISRWITARATTERATVVAA